MSNIDGERFLNLHEEVVTIEGVYDLPMIGGERLDIEHAYQSLTNGPDVTLECLEGVFVGRPDGTMCQLVSFFKSSTATTPKKSKFVTFLLLLSEDRFR